MGFYQSFFAIILLTIVTIAYPVQSQTDSEISKLEKYLYDRCQNGKPGDFEKLRTDVYEMYEYMKKVSQLLPNEREYFCKTERPNLAYRAEQIGKDFNSCMPKEEKFFGQFFRDSFNGYLHFLCHNHGEYSRRFFSQENTQCRQTIAQSNSNDLENCMNRIFPPSKGHIKKAELCDDVTVLRKCFSQLLQVYCPNTSDLKRLNEIFFDNIERPCNGALTAFINKTAFFGLVFFTLVFNLVRF
ncbi:uncharacterized protein LOC126741467 [Anthonomus grandis grandis]|uniref:uncharacterized protein LOC126741467 n=1 Tax=Anthonomus grandis grandis TaxID=2921223 RepID=UPI0021651BE8|nr:uncharacterized protein LOC126741467 [Anthonomus grandis grandis]